MATADIDIAGDAPDRGIPGGSIQVEVVRAWPRNARQVVLQLPPESTVAAALAASGLDDGDVAAYAVFGEKATLDTVLHDGDRVELLRRLTIDPKDARRRRARR